MLGLIPLWAKAAAAAAILAALAGVYAWRVHAERNVGRAEVRAEWSKADQVRDEAQREIEKLRRLAASKASGGHEDDKTAIQVKFRTITERIEHEVEKVVYRNVCILSDGLRELNAAIAATGTTADTAESGKPVPSVKPAQ